MDVEQVLPVLIPLLVLVVLWTVVRHWILPFVLGFALAVALGPSARPMIASAWAAVVQVGDSIFGASGGSLDPRAGEWEDERPRRRLYEEERR